MTLLHIIFAVFTLLLLVMFIKRHAHRIILGAVGAYKAALPFLLPHDFYRLKRKDAAYRHDIENAPIFIVVAPRHSKQHVFSHDQSWPLLVSLSSDESHTSSVWCVRPEGIFWIVPQELLQRRWLWKFLCWRLQYARKDHIAFHGIILCLDVDSSGFDHCLNNKALLALCMQKKAIPLHICLTTTYEDERLQPLYRALGQKEPSCHIGVTYNVFSHSKVDAINTLQRFLSTLSDQVLCVFPQIGETFGVFEGMLIQWMKHSAKAFEWFESHKRYSARIASISVLCEEQATSKTIFSKDLCSNILPRYAESYMHYQHDTWQTIQQKRTPIWAACVAFLVGGFLLLDYGHTRTRARESIALLSALVHTPRSANAQDIHAFSRHWSRLSSVYFFDFYRLPFHERRVWRKALTAIYTTRIVPIMVQILETKQHQWQQGERADFATLLKRLKDLSHLHQLQSALIKGNASAYIWHNMLGLAPDMMTHATPEHDINVHHASWATFQVAVQSAFRQLQQQCALIFDKRFFSLAVVDFFEDIRHLQDMLNRMQHGKIHNLNTRNFRKLVQKVGHTHFHSAFLDLKRGIFPRTHRGHFESYAKIVGMPLKKMQQHMNHFAKEAREELLHMALPHFGAIWNERYEPSKTLLRLQTLVNTWNKDVEPLMHMDNQDAWLAIQQLLEAYDRWYRSIVDYSEPFKTIGRAFGLIDIQRKIATHISYLHDALTTQQGANLTKAQLDIRKSIVQRIAHMLKFHKFDHAYDVFMDYQEAYHDILWQQLRYTLEKEGFYGRLDFFENTVPLTMAHEYLTQERTRLTRFVRDAVVPVVELIDALKEERLHTECYRFWQRLTQDVMQANSQPDQSGLLAFEKLFLDCTSKTLQERMLFGFTPQAASIVQGFFLKRIEALYTHLRSWSEQHYYRAWRQKYDRMGQFFTENLKANFPFSALSTQYHLSTLEDALPAHVLEWVKMLEDIPWSASMAELNLYRPYATFLNKAFAIKEALKKMILDKVYLRLTISSHQPYHAHYLQYLTDWIVSTGTKEERFFTSSVLPWSTSMPMIWGFGLSPSAPIRFAHSADDSTDSLYYKWHRYEGVWSLWRFITRCLFVTEGADMHLDIPLDFMGDKEASRVLFKMHAQIYTLSDDGKTPTVIEMSVPFLPPLYEGDLMPSTTFKIDGNAKAPGSLPQPTS